MEKRFKSDEHEGTWGALTAAKAWLDDQGLSYGPMQRGAPMAIFPDGHVPKWRNIREEAKEEMIGTIESTGGTFRDADVVVEVDAEFVEVSTDEQ